MGCFFRSLVFLPVFNIELTYRKHTNRLHAIEYCHPILNPSVLFFPIPHPHLPPTNSIETPVCHYREPLSDQRRNKTKVRWTKGKKKHCKARSGRRLKETESDQSHHCQLLDLAIGEFLFNPLREKRQKKHISPVI